jgi:hypothetical protein
VTLHILARINDSEVVNEIGTIEVDVHLREIDRSIDTEAAAEATMVADFNLARALREMADEIEAGI